MSDQISQQYRGVPPAPTPTPDRRVIVTGVGPEGEPILAKMAEGASAMDAMAAQIAQVEAAFRDNYRMRLLVHGLVRQRDAARARVAELEAFLEPFAPDFQEGELG